MARGTQLQDLVTKLRLELGRDPSSGQGQQELTRFKKMLEHTQEELYEEHDWEFLSIHRDESLVAGSRYYSFDADLSFERVERAEVKVDGTWYPVSYGITPDHYNTYDSADDERSDRVLCWDAYESDQFEVWPLPNANDQSLRFYGTKNLSRLTADTDRADLDDLLIVTTAAAKLATNETQMSSLLARAAGRLSRLKANDNKTTVFNMGGRGSRATSNRVVRITHVD